jgi:hypothetical protein
MYDFKQVNHGTILTHAVLVGLTPLIPIPFVDDWAKTIFQRRMIRQVTQARGLTLNNQEIETLLQEDFWDNCLEGCVGVGLRLLREIFSKIFFWIEWRRALSLISITYYTGFLLDAALLDGYTFTGDPKNRLKEAAILYSAIRRTRAGANLKLIQRLVSPRALLGAAWTLVRRTIGMVPRMLLALPGAIWQGIRSAPGAVVRGVISFPRRVRNAFYLRIQVLLGREKAPEIQAVQRIAQSMQDALLRIDPSHFDALHQRLQAELARERGQTL